MKGKFSLMWRVAIALVLALSLSLVMAVPVAAIGTLTGVSATSTSYVSGASDLTYTIGFTTATDGTIRYVDMTFADDFNVADATLGDVATSPVVANFNTGTIDISGQTVTYTVTDPAAISASTAITIKLNLIDNPDTAGSYDVTVLTRATSIDIDLGSTSVAITAAPPDHLAVTGAKATMVAGTVNELTVTACDSGDAVEKTYTGEKTLVFSGPLVAPDGTAPTVGGVTMGNEVTVTFAEGVSESVTLIAYNVGTPDVEVTDGTVSSEANEAYDLDLTVTAAAAAQLAYTANPTSVVAGVVTGVFTVEMHDAYGNDATKTSDLTVTLASDSTGAAKEFRATSTGGPVTSVTILAAASDADFYYYDELAGAWTITASATGLTSATSTLTVSPAAIDSYTVSAIASPQATYAAFPVTIQAQDKFDNNITSGDNARDTVAITILNAAGGVVGTVSPTPTTTTAGTATVNVTLDTATLGQTIIFTSGDDAAKSGTSNPFQVIVGSCVHNATQDTYYDTIQAAVTDADAGETIDVSPGTYKLESTTLNIALDGLTLQATGTAAETIITETADAGAIEITGNEVTVDGFTVKAAQNGIRIESATNATVKNNIITTEAAIDYMGIYISSSVGSTVSGNVLGEKCTMHVAERVSDCTLSGNTFGTAVILVAGGFTTEKLTITGNTMIGSPFMAIGFCDGTFDDILIEDNTISRAQKPDVGAIEIRAVTVTNLRILGNDITDNEADGISIVDEAVWGSGNVINNNNITGNVAFGIENLMSSTEQVIDAENNWWGQASGPATDQIDGPVGFTPWLTSEYGVTPVTTIDLVEGWNLVSLMLIPEDSTIGVVLDGVDVDKVAGYSPFQEWKLYDPGVSTVLSDMDDGWGYWVDMNTADTLIVSGYETCEPVPATPPTYNVVVGWNLIGFKSTTSKPIEDYLGPAIAGTLEAIYGYNASTGVYFIPLTNLEPGYGYWLAVNATGTIYP